MTPIIAVTGFDNNGYNGSITFDVTIRRGTVSVTVDGSNSSLSQSLRQWLFSVTAWDDEFFYYDDESEALAVENGYLEPEVDHWGDHEVTDKGMEYYNSERISALNEMIGDEILSNSQNELRQVILDLVNE